MMETLPTTTSSPIACEVIGLDDRSIRVVACPRPFSTRQVRRGYAAGTTLAEILADVQPDEALRRCSHVFIDDMRVTPELLRRVRPKPGTLVNVRCVPMGGSNNKILRTILQIAIAAAAIALGVFTAGAGFPILAALVPVALGTVGGLLVNTLIAPPVIGAALPPRRRIS